MRPFHSSFWVCTLLAACAVGPEHQRPEVPMPPALASITGETPAGPGTRFTDAEPWAEWWRTFDDPELVKLVGAAMRGNQDLRAAAARVRAARALARGADAALLPTLDARGGYTREKRSNAYFGGPGNTEFTDPYSLWSTTLDTSWEIDLFGRLTQQEEAYAQEAEAQQEDLHGTRVALAADVAQAWFDLGTAAARQRILLETVTSRTRTLELIRARVDAGLAGELELHQAQGQLDTARSQLPEAQLEHELAGHRLALLLGRPPGEVYAGREPALVAVPPEIPIGIPAALLQRRPDLRAAERRLAAQNARLRAAIAEFYPSITILGRYGYESRELDRLVTSPTEVWSIAPAISLPIFRGGLLRAQEMEVTARKDEAAARYLHVALGAFREVADALAGIRRKGEARDRLAEVVAAERRALDIASVQYEQGLTPYLNVLEAERALLVSRLALLDAQRAALLEVVRLCKALGGGWQAEAAVESDL